MAEQFSGSDDVDKLVSDAFNGDPDAFERIALIFTPVLLRFFRRRGGVDPEELAQKTWLRVVANLASFDTSRDFRVWLFSIAYRLWIDELRKQAKEPTRKELFDASVLNRSHNPDDLADLAEVIKGCLQDLQDIERRIIYYRFWEDHDLDQIATDLGISYGSAKGKAFRAGRKLRICLEQHGIRRI